MADANRYLVFEPGVPPHIEVEEALDEEFGGIARLFREPRRYRRQLRLPRPPMVLDPYQNLAGLFKENRAWRRSLRTPRAVARMPADEWVIHPVPVIPYAREWLIKHFAADLPQMESGPTNVSVASSVQSYNIVPVVTEYFAPIAQGKDGPGEKENFIYRQSRVTSKTFKLVDRVMWAMKTDEEKHNSKLCDEKLLYYLKEQCLFMKRTDLTARFLALKATRYLEKYHVSLSPKQREEMIANVVMQAIQLTPWEKYCESRVAIKDSIFQKASPSLLDLTRFVIRIIF